MNDTLMDAVARFTDEDVNAFRREWNAQFEQTEAPLPQTADNHSKNVHKTALMQGAISARVLMRYLSSSSQSEERQVIVRRVIKTAKDIFVDVFCLDISAPRLVKLDNIVQIVDINTKTMYPNPRNFFENVLEVDLADKPVQAPVPKANQGQSSLQKGELKTAIDLTRYEITALLFCSGVDGNRDAAELRSVVDYVHARCPNLSFHDADLLQYLRMIYPDNQSFYDALEKILQKEAWVIQMFVEKLISLIKADGKIEQREKEFLSEFISILKEEGVDLNFEKLTV